MATIAPRRTRTEDTGPPLSRGSGRVALGGNELIVKGALEAGVSLITGYPGSPVAEVFTVCESHAALLTELGVEAVLANNEAQSGAMLNGARQAPGARAMAVFKSVGAFVALDALAIANAAQPADGAGAVVVVGDDPSLSSTQVGADSRVTMSAARVPVLEPASNQELKDVIGHAFALSVASGLIVAVLVTTAQADGAGTVELGPNLAPAVGPRARVTLDTGAVRVHDAVSLPPQATALEADQLHRRLPAVQAAAGLRGLDRTERAVPGGAPIGIVTSGACYPLLRDALARLGADGHVPILRLGLTWPLDPDRVSRFAAGVEEVVVMEERGPVIEDQVRRALDGRRTPVWGKRFPDGPGFPEASGLSPDRALAALARLVRARPDAFGPSARGRVEEVGPRAAPRRRATDVAARTPTYCAGCPHRGTSSPMIEIRRRLADPAYMRRVHGRGPVDVIAHGGIGCYSLASLPPFEEMHDLSAMGLGGATGAGSAPHVTNAHYTLVGDGTFFHGEMSTIANAIKARQDILFIILDNKNTAMTGHQGTPGSATDLLGRPQTPLEIERIVAAMRPAFLARADPDDRDAYLALLERAFLMEGTRVVIADKECAITSGRRQKAARAAEVREHGFLREVTRYNVVEEVCENCRACTTATGCPGLTLVDTPLGEKVGIAPEICVDDGICAAIKACPSFEKVTVRRSRAPERAPAPRRDLSAPPRGHHDGAEAVAVRIGGVGGMGVGVLARVLVEAGARRWAEVDAYQKRGLAQRGGAVHADVVLHDGARPRPAEISRGGADLILGVDPLEGARGLALADPTRTVAVMNTALTPTTGMLTGADAPRSDPLAGAAERCRPGGLLAADFSAACAEGAGGRLYAGIAMLGAAYQRGWLPLDGESLEVAVRGVTGSRAEANLAAFALGRALAHDAADDQGAPPTSQEPEELEALLAAEEGWIRGRHARRAFREGVARARAIGLDEETLRALAPRLPEVLAWGGPAYAESYLDQLARVRAAAPELVGAAVVNLHRTMAIKDEVFVAHLLTSPKKYARDRARFGVDPARGDRISYVHLTRPAFDVLGVHLERDLPTRDGMLRLARRARFARRLLPAWHRRERGFRDWYATEVLGAVCTGALTGAAAEGALRLPEAVTGYREIRYPKEDAARARFAALVAGSGEEGS